MSIESENARHEIKEIIEGCIKCGLCKSLCPVFRAVREETISPRGFVIQFENDVYEKNVYDCTLCRACDEKCPVGIKLCDAFLKARMILAEEGKCPKEGKEIAEKFRDKNKEKENKEEIKD